MLSKKGLLRVTIIFFQTNYNFKMLITPERKVPQRSDASQNARAIALKHQQTLHALGIRLFIRLFKIRLNSPNLNPVLLDILLQFHCIGGLTPLLVR